MSITITIEDNGVWGITSNISHDYEKFKVSDAEGYAACDLFVGCFPIRFNEIDTIIKMLKKAKTFETTSPPKDSTEV